MAEEAIEIGGKNKSIFLDKVKELLPDGGNLNLCLTCGACSSGCPATGLEDMDPRKFLRMAALGMDKEITSTPWSWMISIARSGLIPSEGTNFLQSGPDCKNSTSEHNFEIESIIQLYAKWIREGKLKVNSDWNKDLKIKFTVQDPFQLVRKSFGDPRVE